MADFSLLVKAMRETPKGFFAPLSAAWRAVKSNASTATEQHILQPSKVGAEH